MKCQAWSDPACNEELCWLTVLELLRARFGPVDPQISVVEDGTERAQNAGALLAVLHAPSGASASASSFALP